MSQASVAHKRVLSGIQPTGHFHLGNYVGAMEQWLEWQKTAEALFCIVDLHTLTLPENVHPKLQPEWNREMVAVFLACGIDPNQSAVFLQSHVREITELQWVLTCVTPVGWLERMTQYKTKSEGLESIGSGLLQYPVLQAADILLYETDIVPVGEDQKQHIEITCDIAQRFNHLFGETFKIPKEMIRENGARIMGFDNPLVKMSKSIGVKKAGHMVSILDDEKTVKKTIMSSVTDSGQTISFKEGSPGVLNLLSIYEVLTRKVRENIEQEFSGKGYGHLKKAVFEVVWETFLPIQERYHAIRSDKAYVEEVLLKGAEKVRPIAQKVIKRVRENVGIG